MLTLSLALLAAAAQNPRFPETVHAGAVAPETAIASANDQSLMLWVEQSSQHVQIAYADGRGVQWSAPARIDDDAGSASKTVTARCLAATEDHIYAVWMDDRNGASDAYLALSADGGWNWSTPQRIDDGYLAGAQAVTDLQVTADGPYLYIALRVLGPSGSEDIMMASSMDSGASWNATLKANAGTADCDAMAICCEGINVFVAWADDRHAAGLDDVFLRMSHDGGANWMMTMMDEQIDASGPGVGNVEGDRLAMAGGMTGLVVAWMENQTATTGSDCELHARYSPDGGHMWPFPEATLASGADVAAPTLAMDQATILLAWQDDRSGVDQIFAAVSKDYTLNWTEHALSAGAGHHAVAQGYGEIWGVSWIEENATPQVKLAMSRDIADSFLTPTTIQSSIDDAEQPELVYNRRYENFIASWVEQPSAARSLMVGGARPQTLQALSPGFAVGDPVQFLADHFPVADAGTPFAVLLSSGMGDYRLPFGDGRNTGLLDNPYQPAYLPQLSGTINLHGHGATPVLSIPNTPGATWYAVGVAYLASHSATYLLRMTDLAVIQVQ